jgi:RNA-directed DNA polymerase
MDKTKSYGISKKVVLEAYQRVKANQGAAGIDDESLAAFEANLKNNLYKIWNRMSSGSYFPPAVKGVEIPKKSGGKRLLGIPTVSDRVAQMVVKIYFEPKVEPYFHRDSYGYRPGKSALDAIAITRQRSWEYDWVLEIDIKGLFDNIDHELLMKAVRQHTDNAWNILYGRFYKSDMYSIYYHLNLVLIRWAMRKYKKLRAHKIRAYSWLSRIARQQPKLFVHWQLGVFPRGDG